MIIRVRSREPFPAWSFANYLGGTAENYAKLLQIHRVITALDAGADDRQFYVGAYSSDLYPISEIELPTDFIPLAEKGESADDFWRQIRRLKRPVIFFRVPNRRDEPLFQMADREALRVIRAKSTSPFDISFEGLGEVVRQLFYGHKDEARRQDVHELEIEERRISIARQRVKLGREALTLADEVGRSHVSPPIKRAILSAVSDVSDRQLILDQRATIEIVANDNED